MPAILIKYLVNQILLGALTYQEIIISKPEYKVGIDAYIEEKNLDIDKTK